MKPWLPMMLFCVAASAQAVDHGKPAELPKELVAVRAGADLHASKTIHVRVNSRRTEDPPMPVRAEKLKNELKKAMEKIPLKLVDDPSAAEWNAELVIEPHERWGEFHSQNSPYLFLLLRDHATANVVYCGWQRVGWTYDGALKNLAKGLVQQTTAGATAATGDLQLCAKEAMRLVDVTQ